MTLRLIELILSAKEAEDLHQLLKTHPLIEHSELQLIKGNVLVRILITPDQTDAVLDQIELNYANKKNYRVVIMPVEATLPRPEQLVSSGPPAKERVGREELLESVKNMAQCSKTYISMVILSTIVAAVGLHNNNVAVIIGAMVIAPMLGPNIALSLGLLLGDVSLLRRAVSTGLTGISIAILLSVIFGIFVHTDPGSPEIISRTQMHRGDLAVALASGFAGALAFTTGVSATLIGVMVAVSLLPPLVTFGLLLGDGQTHLALGAIFLFLLNLISVNLAAVTVFLIQGIHPMGWVEKKLAQKSSRIFTIGIWIVLLLTLLLILRLDFFS